LSGGFSHGSRGIAIRRRKTADTILVLYFLFNVRLARIADVLGLVRNRR
jgi:hypothetical protein